MGARNTGVTVVSEQEPLNILQIYSSPSPGGGTVHVADLAAGLAERGRSVHVACRVNGHVPRLLEGRRAEIHTFPLPGGLDLPSVIRVAALVKRQRIDILHAHSGRDYALCRSAHRSAGRGQEARRVVVERFDQKCVITRRESLCQDVLAGAS
jgi:glycosyltransferase involved in cell wall biosynthesis